METKGPYRIHNSPPPARPEPDQSSPCSQPTSWTSILILSSHLRLGLTIGFFPYGFPTKTLYAPLLSAIRAICPAHLILLDLITRIYLMRSTNKAAWHIWFNPNNFYD
jgi:hypothetical protein